MGISPFDRGDAHADLVLDQAALAHCLVHMGYQYVLQVARECFTVLSLPSERVNPSVAFGGLAFIEKRCTSNDAIELLAQLATMGLTL